MKAEFGLMIAALVGMLCAGCGTKPAQLPLVGTWELVSATTTEKDTTFSTFDSRNKFIKIINLTHFAFLNHNLRAKADTSAGTFTAGGGTYTMNDSLYIENLEYYTDRKWENNKFEFIVAMKGDTLVQKGVEKVDKLGIDRVIIEKYKRAN